MMACIIEFSVKDGHDDDRKRLLAELLMELEHLPGFLSKETFDDVDHPGRRITISWWTDAEALRAWMGNTALIRAIGQGKRETLSHYNIKIATVERERSWMAPAPAAAAWGGRKACPGEQRVIARSVASTRQSSAMTTTP